MSQAATTWVPEDTFASRLRTLRDAMHLTVPEICELCEIPVPTWRGWEHGASPRGLDRHARRIAEKTGVDLSWLLLGRASASGYNPTEDVGFPSLEVIPGAKRVRRQLPLPLFFSAVTDGLAAAVPQ